MNHLILNMVLRDASASKNNHMANSKAPAPTKGKKGEKAKKART